jgi:two-component system sensor histidine kinase TtrS
MKNTPFAGRLIAWLLAWLLPYAASAGNQEVTVGVLAHRGTETAVQMWTPTVDHIGSMVMGYDFRLVPINLHELPAALERDELDFILTNPGNYVELEAEYGITRIATLKNIRQGRVSKTFGAVIFTRADRDDIHVLRDLRGKKFAAVDEGAFGGFQMAWREFKEAGIDPFSDFSELRFAGFPQDDIVFDVRDGWVDAGTVRTDILEGLASQGVIDLAAFRILNPQLSGDFPFRHSTRLYPEWAFAKARSTPETLAREVAVALLQMPEDHPAARGGDYAGWTVPLNYQPVHDLFMALEIGPYARSSQFTLVDVIQQYWYWLALMLAIILFSLSLNILVKRQVVGRTTELSRSNRALEMEIAERKRAEEESRALLRENRSLIRKSVAVQESERRHLARELHDELGQCITAIQADAEIIRDRAGDCDTRLVISATAIQDVSSRIYEVVHSMMQRLRPPMLDDLGLVETLQGEVDVWQSRQPGAACSLRIGGDLTELGEQLNMAIYRIVQECLTNTAKHASAHSVSIQLHRTGMGPGNGAAEYIRLVVRDDGAGFDPAVRGSGLGLIGMRERVEALAGTFGVVSTPGAGTTVTVNLPLTASEAGAS